MNLLAPTQLPHENALVCVSVCVYARVCVRVLVELFR